MAKKGPALASCDERQTSCYGPKSDPRNGCPNCEYTIQYNFFIKELDQELKDIRGGTRKGGVEWPRAFLLNALNEIAVIAGSVPKGTYGPKWPVVTANLVSVYRSEISRAEGIEIYVPEPRKPKPMNS